VILVAFKAIDPALRESGGGFDSHTLPPTLQVSATYARISVVIRVPVMIRIFRAGGIKEDRTVAPGIHAAKAGNSFQTNNAGRAFAAYFVFIT
jgi:uncharacterized protein YqfA (UPF0365 family)